MKKITANLRKNKQGICAIAFIVLFFLFVGITGAADMGGDMTEYTIRAEIVLVCMFILIKEGRLYDYKGK